MVAVIAGALVTLGGGMMTGSAVAAAQAHGAVARARQLLGWDRVPIPLRTPPDMLRLLGQLD